MNDKMLPTTHQTIETELESDSLTPLDKKIMDLFPGEAVNKELTKKGLLASRALPSFVADWLIQKFSDGKTVDVIGLQRFLDSYLPDKNLAGVIKHRLMNGEIDVKILAEFRVNPHIQSGEEYLEIPALDIGGKEATINSGLLDKNPSLLTGGDWGMGELVYLRSERKNESQVILKGFTPFRPYRPNLDYYRKARQTFTDVNEWIDFLIKCMEYDPKSFTGVNQKLMMLKRLLPFIEPRLNLIELAPKATGKSYVFGRLSKWGWLISGGSISRAQLFYDVSKKRHGIIKRYDYVALDEIQTIKFVNPEEIVGALKGYLESGTYNVMSQSSAADAGLVILGNIALNERLLPVSPVYTRELPSFMQETALLDRFHGFIEGWKLPRITEGSITKGYALNSEFFSEILHTLRSDTMPMGVINHLIEVPPKADKRDTTAVKRLATGFLKLLYPHVQSPDQIDIHEFERFCFQPALNMRRIIRLQMHLMDEEYSEDMPNLVLRGS